MLTQAWLNSRQNKFFNKKSLLLIFLCFTSSCDIISNRLLTKPIVQVEDRKLSAKDFSKELASSLKNYDALSAKDPKILSSLKGQIINNFVIDSIIDLWLTEKKVFISKEELDKELKSVISTYPTDAAFQEALSETDMSYSQWVNKIEASLKKKKLSTLLAKDAAAISNEELMSYYESHKTLYQQKEAVALAHIAIEDENQADIVKKLLRQESFEVVAKKYSLEYSEEAKDNYGWIEKDYANGLDKVFKLRNGEVFGPIKVGDRLQIFKVLEKRAFKQKSFIDVRAEVLSEVQSLRDTARFTAWLDVQFKRYKIKKNLNMLESIRVETQ